MLVTYPVNKPLSFQDTMSSSGEEDIQMAGMHKVRYLLSHVINIYSTA